MNKQEKKEARELVQKYYDSVKGEGDGSPELVEIMEWVAKKVKL